jgi:hypothetical protein
MMPRVLVTDEERAFIEERIDRYADEAPTELQWQLRYVRAHGALPLYVGWTETAAIRPNGEMVRWSTEGDWPGVRELNERIWVTTALVRGAERYPQLWRLVPSRPEALAHVKSAAGRAVFHPMPRSSVSAAASGGSTAPISRRCEANARGSRKAAMVPFCRLWAAVSAPAKLSCQSHAGAPERSPRGTLLAAGSLAPKPLGSGTRHGTCAIPAVDASVRSRRDASHLLAIGGRAGDLRLRAMPELCGGEVAALSRRVGFSRVPAGGPA